MDILPRQTKSVDSNAMVDERFRCIGCIVVEPLATTLSKSIPSWRSSKKNNSRQDVNGQRIGRTAIGEDTGKCWIGCNFSATTKRGCHYLPSPHSKGRELRGATKGQPKKYVNWRERLQLHFCGLCQVCPDHTNVSADHRSITTKTPRRQWC